MDVLVFTPVLRLEPATVKAIMALEWDGPLSFLFQRDNPGVNGKANHHHQYVRGREVFLRGPYDAMLVVESDVVPPANALTRLAALDADIAYGCYMLRGVNVVNVLQRYPQPARNTGESLSIHPELWEQALKDGQIECSGAGLGCVLIKRHVLEAVPFRMPEPDVFSDFWWTEDVHQGGYTMKADMLVLCGHIDTDGTMLWPK